MSKVKWDQAGERLYETGVDHVVLYPYDKTNGYKPGVAWNGVSKITEGSDGAEEKAIYADNIKYIAPRSREEFKPTIEAYTYPDEFAALDGSASISGVPGLQIKQQKRGLFGLCYRTKIGNDEDDDEHGYKLHLVYGCTAAPSDVDRDTINEDPDAVQFSWELATTPVEVGIAGFKPTAHLVITSTDFTTENESLLAALEAKLYGTDGTGGSSGTDPELPLPLGVATLLGYTPPNS